MAALSRRVQRAERSARGGRHPDAQPDAFYYAYTDVTGDFTITARVTSIQAVNAWTKAGVMIRNTLSASSAHGFMLVASSPTKGVPYQRRKTDGDISDSSSGSQSTAPRWVKLVRMGNTITGYESADGVTWRWLDLTRSSWAPTCWSAWRCRATSPGRRPPAHSATSRFKSRKQEAGSRKPGAGSRS